MPTQSRLTRKSACALDSRKVVFPPSNTSRRRAPGRGQGPGPRLYYTILYYIILHYTMLYYTMSYWLYQTVLYYAILYWARGQRGGGSRRQGLGGTMAARRALLALWLAAAAAGQATRRHLQSSVSYLFISDAFKMLKQNV